MTADEGKPDLANVEVAPEHPIEVRETRTLFRLVPVANTDLSRSSRQIAIVAADTEAEARLIAFMHDASGCDWRDPQFAACEALETTEIHVHGDVIFRSEPVAVPNQKRVAKHK
jgi:hypothetical protein